MDVPLRPEALWTRVVELLGSEIKAERWFYRPLSELDNRTPQQAVHEASIEEVQVVLDRIAYGVFS
jgi:uncharacterized protein (DUF2384 family)